MYGFKYIKFESGNSMLSPPLTPLTHYSLTLFNFILSLDKNQPRNPPTI